MHTLVSFTRRMTAGSSQQAAGPHATEDKDERARPQDLPVYTRNPSDFDALKAIIKVVPV